MRFHAVIVAAGSSLRFDSHIPKQYIPYKERPVLWHSLNAFLEAGFFSQIIICVNLEHKALYEPIIDSLDTDNILTVSGGETRQKSVYNGLLALEKQATESDVVFIHDAARANISRNLIKKLKEATNTHSAIVPVVPVRDTIKMIQNNVVIKTLPRDEIFAVQTPQVFNFHKILTAHRALIDENHTDDSSIAEAFGIKVHAIDGEQQNFKITYQSDMEITGGKF